MTSYNGTDNNLIKSTLSFRFHALSKSKYLSLANKGKFFLLKSKKFDSAEFKANLVFMNAYA